MSRCFWCVTSVRARTHTQSVCLHTWFYFFIWNSCSLEISCCLPFLGGYSQAHTHSHTSATVSALCVHCSHNFILANPFMIIPFVRVRFFPCSWSFVYKVCNIKMFSCGIQCLRLTWSNGHNYNAMAVDFIHCLNISLAVEFTGRALICVSRLESIMTMAIELYTPIKWVMFHHKQYCITNSNSVTFIASSRTRSFIKFPTFNLHSMQMEERGREEN